MSANTSPPVTIDLKPPPPDFILALADVIRFIDKKRANANANPPPAADDITRPERPLHPPNKERI